MVEQGNKLQELEDENFQSCESTRGCGFCCGPVKWLRMLATHMHWSFVFGVVVVYGLSEGLGGSLNRVGTEYYMKDVQKVQPSESQIYSGITSIPWMVKPLWGLLTDVVPILGYRRRPYFIIAGVLGISSMLFLSLHKNLHIFLAVLLLTAGSASVAIGDVTVDACVAQNSYTHPSLAADMQSLCSLSSSVGALTGFALSGILVHRIGPLGVYGLLILPSMLVVLAGMLLKEPQIPGFCYKGVGEKFVTAASSMWATLKLPQVWRPCLYMYLSLASSLNVYEGMFYWYTDSNGGPNFSQEFVGYIFSFGSVGSLLGALLYQYTLKNYPFRNLCFWAQLFIGLWGMLDLFLVLRWNQKLGINDHLFAVLDECAFQLIGRIKWMPLLVLSAKLCPPGIEGTFFALVMSIDNLGLFTCSWFGGLLLRVLNITRTNFDNLWLAILIRNLMRMAPLAVVFLVPAGDPGSSILPDPIGSEDSEGDDEVGALENENIELVSLVHNVDSSR